MNEAIKYDIKPIETYYNGQHFKSILEAKWACFFDQCNWKWAYEPYKINKKIPDFVLVGHSINIIVEVKPDAFINHDFIETVRNNYYLSKYHIFILSDKPFYFFENKLTFGFGFEYSEKGYHYSYAPFFMKSENDFSSYEFNWDGIIHKHTDRKEFLLDNSELHQPSISVINSSWLKAGMVTKFNAY